MKHGNSHEHFGGSTLQPKEITGAKAQRFTVIYLIDIYSTPLRYQTQSNGCGYRKEPAAISALIEVTHKTKNSNYYVTERKCSINSFLFLINGFLSYFPNSQAAQVFLLFS